MSEMIIDIDPCTDTRWGDLHAVGGGTLFTSSAWMSAVTSTYGFEPRARLVLADGEPIAGVAYCTIDDIRGMRVVSFPFSDFADPIGDKAAAGRAVTSLTGDRPVRMKIRAPRLPTVDPAADHRRDLLWHSIRVQPGCDEIDAFAALNPKVRQNIRRAQREGIDVVERTDIGAVRDFYDLHVAVRTRKYGLLPQPFSFFEQLHRAFAEDRLIVVLAMHEERPIAGIVFIECGESLYYKFNASMADHLRGRPNELLLWHGMQLAASRGLSAVDLGVSDIDQPGLIRYKRKMAHDECEVVSLQYPSAVGGAGDGGDVGRVLGQVTELLVDEQVPTSVTLKAADLLYRYFA